MVSLKRKLIENASWLLIGQTLHKIISYLIILIIGRTAGDVGLGQYAFVISFTGFVSYLSDFGINYYIMREIARDKTRKDLVSHALSFKVLLTILDWFLIVFLALQLDKDPIVKTAIILYGSASVFSTIGMLFSSIIFAHEVTKYETFALLTERVLTLLVGGFILFKTGYLFAFFAVLTVNVFLLNLLRIYFGFKFVSPRLVFKPERWLDILSKAYVFWFIYIFSFVYYDICIIILGIIESDEIVGWYRAGYFFIQAIMLIPYAIVNITLPTMSRLWVEDRKILKNLFKRVVQVLLMLGILSSGGVFLLSPLLIRLFFGQEFLNSVEVLRILGWTIPAAFLNSLYGSLLNGIGKEKIYSKIVGVTTILNIFLNYILISLMSYIGAAIATLLINWTVTVMFSIVVFKKDKLC